MTVSRKITLELYTYTIKLLQTSQLFGKHNSHLSIRTKVALSFGLPVQWSLHIVVSLLEKVGPLFQIPHCRCVLSCHVVALLEELHTHLKRKN